MTAMSRTHDCVEMKDRVQKQLREEYETRRSEFSCYADFINATAEESEEIRAYWAKIAAAKNVA